MIIKKSCIQTISQDKFIIVREWQQEYCEDNTTACALLSLLERWHNFKLTSYKKSGDPNDLLQYHTDKQIEDQIIGVGKRDNIRKAKKLLVKLGAITIHQNPQKRKDRKTFFLFHPDKINHWLNTVHVSKIPKMAVDNCQKIPTEAQKIKSLNNQQIKHIASAQSFTQHHCRKIDNVLSENRQCLSIHKRSLHNKKTTPDDNNNLQQKILPTDSTPSGFSFDEWCLYFIALNPDFKLHFNRNKFKAMIKKWIQQKYRTSDIMTAIHLTFTKIALSDIQMPHFFDFSVDLYIQDIRSHSQRYPGFYKYCGNRLKKVA